jgi:tetratricopeptide (TPR) repeat protein
MIALIVVAMIVGSFFSILWPIVYLMIQNRMVLGDNQPPANATNDERGAYYLAAMKKAQDNKLGGETIPRTALNYAGWLCFDCRNYQEAKKAYLKCAELCSGTDSGAVRTIQADALMDSAFCDHRLYYANQGQPPDIQVALAAQKEQIEAARSMGWTDDANDVERQRRALENIADYYCDNGKHADAMKYADDAIAGANKNHATQVSTALTYVAKARVLAGLGKNDEADKEFRQAVKIADTAYGAGSDASELCIRH